MGMIKSVAFARSLVFRKIGRNDGGESRHGEGKKQTLQLRLYD